LKVSVVWNIGRLVKGVVIDRSDKLADSAFRVYAPFYDCFDPEIGRITLL
jgi:hypothetical protein